MHLDWAQIQALTPALPFIEELHLAKNKCSKITSEYEIDPKAFKHLKYLNLESNGITDWDEIQGFRNCSSIKFLNLSDNQISEIKYRPGFKEMYVVSLDDNNISTWDSIDQLNEYHQVKRLRISNNPILTQTEGGEKAARAQIIARLKYLERYRGGDISQGERKDCEVYYMKQVYNEYIKEVGKAETLEDEKLLKYMMEKHPRWYELAEIYGSPIDELNSVKQKGKSIKSNAMKVQIVSKLPDSEGKTLKKKLLEKMTVGQLKHLVCKLFKVDILDFTLNFKQEEVDQLYELEEDIKELSYYCLYEDATIFVNPTS